MTTRDQLFKKYEELREAYLKRFGEEAPEYLPIENEDAIKEIEEALETGITLEQIPEGAVS